MENHQHTAARRRLPRDRPHQLRPEVFGQRHFFGRDPEGTWLDVTQLVEPDPEWLAANLPSS